MKIRESGMPDETTWESFFHVDGILDAFAVERFSDVIEIGCGYGTFTINLAQRIRGRLYALDIDPVMVSRTQERASKEPGQENLLLEVCDVFVDPPNVSVDAVVLFNVLHCEDPLRLLRHAARWTLPLGEILVIHWRSDIATPRGPSTKIRPTPAQIAESARACGLDASGVLLPSEWHFGMKLTHKALL